MEEIPPSPDDVEVVVKGTPLEEAKGPKGDRGFRGQRGKTGPAAPQDGDLLDELKRVQSDLGFRKRVRLFLIVLASAVVAALLAAIVSVIALLSVRDYQHEACERDNDLRKAYTDQWSPVIAESPPPAEPSEDAPQELKDAYNAQIRQRDAFIKGLENGFDQHPC